MQLAMRGNLSALRLLWSPLLALRVQMFFAQSPSLMDGVLTLARSGLKGAFLVARCERRAGRPSPPQHSPSEKTARLEYRIDAHAFATWLYTQKQEPSAHIAVWFEVRGVAWPPVLAVAPDDATPVSPFPLVDFDALAAYRKAQKAANVAAGKSHKTIPWTDGNQLEVLRTEYERLGQTPSAYTSIANVLGTTRQAVESALKSERKRKTASPLPSVAAKRIA